MFFEFITKRNEKVTINVNSILFITSHKTGTFIVDVEANEYESNESYESFVKRLNNCVNQNYDKTYKNE